MVYTVTLNPSLDYVVTVDGFAVGKTNRTTSEQMVPGGKGINVSAVLKNLGGETRALGFTAGFVGEEIERRLREAGLECEFIRLREGCSRINVKLEGYDGTEINGMGPAADPAALEELMDRLCGLGEGDVLVLAGSVPGVMPRDLYGRIMERLSGRGILFAVDASGETLLQVLKFHPFLIKPNRDELGELTGAFNRMTTDLKRYVDERVEQQKALSAARLKLYQTQLNPHFLYNTLDTIKWSAKIHQLPEVAVMAENLAGILRQALSSREFVTLKEELETIDSYMAIQKARLPEGFQYEAEVPDSLMSALVPKMLLQPLVENAVLHGVEHDGNGYICIFAAQEGTDLKISVFDDGRGMPPEVVRWINSPSPEKRDGHLGLYNLISILKIHYGEGYGLKARSGDGEGTTITITLPMEENHV